MEFIKLNQITMSKIKFHDNLVNYNDRTIDNYNRLWTAFYIIDDSLDNDVIKLEQFDN